MNDVALLLEESCRRQYARIETVIKVAVVTSQLLDLLLVFSIFLDALGRLVVGVAVCRTKLRSSG